jgi:hypothetical protein
MKLKIDKTSTKRLIIKIRNKKIMTEVRIIAIKREKL